MVLCFVHIAADKVSQWSCNSTSNRHLSRSIMCRFYPPGSFSRESVPTSFALPQMVMSGHVDRSLLRPVAITSFFGTFRLTSSSARLSLLPAFSACGLLANVLTLRSPYAANIRLTSLPFHSSSWSFSSSTPILFSLYLLLFTLPSSNIFTASCRSQYPTHSPHLPFTRAPVVHCREHNSA